LPSAWVHWFSFQFRDPEKPRCCNQALVVTVKLHGLFLCTDELYGFAMDGISVRSGTGNGCGVSTGPIISIIATRSIKFRTASSCEFCRLCALTRFQISHSKAGWIPGTVAKAELGESVFRQQMSERH
jgi:hypothetical protein